MAERDSGLRVAVVPLIEAALSESPVYWLSWYEQWTAASKKLQFLSSSLTIYKGAQDKPKLQLLRAEWAGVQRIERQTDIFQGNGAAHPHWHFDAPREYPEDQDSQFGQESEAIRGAVVEEYRDYGDSQAEEEVASLFGHPAAQSPEKSAHKWSSIHLPVAARWCDEVWPGPEGPHHVHASGPKDPESLRNWLSSCTRYVQAEINKIES